VRCRDNRSYVISWSLASRLWIINKHQANRMRQFRGTHHDLREQVSRAVQIPFMIWNTTCKAPLRAAACVFSSSNAISKSKTPRCYAMPIGYHIFHAMHPDQDSISKHRPLLNNSNPPRLHRLLHERQDISAVACRMPFLLPCSDLADSLYSGDCCCDLQDPLPCHSRGGGHSAVQGVPSQPPLPQLPTLASLRFA
jgi:hypothetical protein